MCEKTKCNHCGNVCPIDEMTMMQNDYLCQSCTDELTTVCERCGEQIFIADAAGDSSIILCEHCRDYYYTECTDCGRLLSCDQAYYPDDAEDEAYCENCYDERQWNNPIHEYSYTPELVFHGKGTRFFGVELEIDMGGQDRHKAQDILNVANETAENLYIKSDGSLNDGLELVTHPMTLEYHLKEHPWAAVLDKSRSLGYLSHRANTCGLHIHIARTAFGYIQEEQDVAIARLLYFVEKFWPELLRFSRRTQGQLNRWANRYGFKLHPKEVLETAKNSNAGRYTAVNLTNVDTVEIRIFRGTLCLNTIFATLQMVDTICDLAIYMSDEEMQALSWYNVLDRIRHAELIQYLKERNLYKNVPVVHEEDT